MWGLVDCHFPCEKCPPLSKSPHLCQQGTCEDCKEYIDCGGHCAIRHDNEETCLHRKCNKGGE